MTNAEELSIVILNWNSTGHVVPCLSAIRSNCPGAEVVLIDNGSIDQAEVVKASHAFRVERFVANRKNLGVARGRNLGVNLASRRYICTLDVDTEVVGDALQVLVAALSSNPSVGLCAPRLESFGGEAQFSCRRFPLVHTKLLRLAPRLDLFGFLAHEEMRGMDRDRPCDVDWVIGACQVYRKEEFLRLGGYDSFSSFGSEDIDFCLRMWMAGKRVLYYPRAVVRHHEQRRARSLLRRVTASHAKSLMLYFWKYRYAFNRERIYRHMPAHPHLLKGHYGG